MLATTSESVFGMAGLGIFGVLIAIVIGALYALFPLIVMWQLGGVKKRLDDASEEDGKEHDEIVALLKAQNTLTRQLLRAYGHDPEA